MVFADSLPTSNIDTHAIYSVPDPDGEGEDMRAEYYRNADNTGWERIGSAGGGISFLAIVSITADAGSPALDGITVNAVPISGASTTPAGTTDASGQCVLEVKQGAKYRVECSKTNYVFSAQPEFTATELNTDVALTCHVAPSLKITVGGVDYAGRTVTITGGPSGTTATDGTCVFNGLTATTYTVRCDYPAGQGIDSETKQVTCVNGEQATLAFTVYPRPSITVKLTSATGNVGGLSVTASSAQGNLTGTTDGSGNLTLGNAYAGAAYSIDAVQPSGYYDISPVSVTPLVNQSNPANLVMYRKPIVNIVLTDDGGQQAGQTITVKVGSETKTATTDSAGQASVVMDSEGSCTVTTSMPSGASGTTSWTGTIAKDGQYTANVSIVRTVVYAYEISVNTSDPVSRVTYPATVTYGGKSYTNAAYGVSKASGHSLNGWVGKDIVEGIKRQTGSGSNWTDVTDKRSAVAGSQGTDVMTYFPTWWLSMANDGTTIRVAFSNNQIDDTFQDYAGSVGANRVGHFRFGNFLSTNSSSKAYSFGGGAPTGSVSLNNWVAYSQARGTGYDEFNWYHWTYLGALFVLLYGSTNCQAALGQGYVGGSSVQSNTALTYDNDYGMAGSTNTKERMSFFWINDLWGNMYQWCGGASTNSSYKLQVQKGYCTQNNTGAENTGAGPSSLVNGYINKVTGTTETGFFPMDDGGSATTYFADYGYVRSSVFPYVGGDYGDGDSAGVFRAYFNGNADRTYSDIGGRLVYRL